MDTGRGAADSSTTEGSDVTYAQTAETESEMANLVRQASAGDRAAWDTIVSKYVSLVWAVALQQGLNSADAADVAQSTWLRLLEHIDDIRDPSRLGAWLATTARRESLRVIALRRRLVPEADPTAFDGPDLMLAELDERLLAEERGQHVREAFSTLPPAWQSLISLLMADPPMSYQEIGEMLGVPVGSIGPTRGRCMTRMRTFLEAS